MLSKWVQRLEIGPIVWLRHFVFVQGLWLHFGMGANPSGRWYRNSLECLLASASIKISAIEGEYSGVKRVMLRFFTLGSTPLLLAALCYYMLASLPKISLNPAADKSLTWKWIKARRELWVEEVKRSGFATVCFISRQFSTVYNNMWWGSTSYELVLQTKRKNISATNALKQVKAPDLDSLPAKLFIAELFLPLTSKPWKSENFGWSFLILLRYLMSLLPFI